jgi:hypothetical protein
VNVCPELGCPTRIVRTHSASKLRTDLVSRRLSARMARRPGYQHDFLWWPVTAIVSLIGDGVSLQLVPPPLTGDWRPATGTVESPFIRKPGNQRQQVGAVSIRAASGQISSAAFRTLNAMASTGCHEKYRLRSMCSPTAYVEKPGQGLFPAPVALFLASFGDFYVRPAVI